jgi:hypothetical protein
MRTEKETREQLEKLKQQTLTGGPYTELKSIALHAAKQALKWVLEESDELLTY